MISQASRQFLGMKTCFFLYVSDVEIIHQRKLKYGAEVVFPLENMDYGDRQGGVKDPFGNFDGYPKGSLKMIITIKKGYHEINCSE